MQVTIVGADSARTPAAGVGVVALPYDRDSVLHSLDARARSPRPSTAPLDSLFAQFREPFTAYARASFEAGKLRDSVDVLRRRIQTTPKTAAAYGELTARVDAQQRALGSAEARRDSAQRKLGRARERFRAHGDSLRGAIRRWEDSTYRGYDSIVQRLATRSTLVPVTDTTGQDGWARLSLKSGPWWIYARAWDATDPNAEWYWNLPVSGDTIRLTPANGRHQPKY